MPHAVSGFFENGGKRLYVCRIVGSGATTASKVFGDLTVTAAGPGAWGRKVWVRIQDGSTKDKDGNCFRLKLAYWSSVGDDFQPYDPFEAMNKDRLPRPQCQEDYDDLSTDPNAPDFFAKRLIDSSTGQPASALGTIARSSGADSRPSPNAETGEFLDQNGADDQAALGADDFTGDETGGRLEPSGLLALELDSYRDVALVYAPHPPDNGPDIIKKIIDHCERQRFRFAAIDCDRDAEPSGLDPRGLTSGTRVTRRSTRRGSASRIRSQAPVSLCHRAGTCLASTRGPTRSAASSRRRRTRSSAARSTCASRSTTTRKRR